MKTTTTLGGSIQLTVDLTNHAHWPNLLMMAFSILLMTTQLSG